MARKLTVGALAWLVVTSSMAQSANLLRNAGFLAAGSGEAPDYWSWQGGSIVRPDWPACWRLYDEHCVAGTRSMRLSDSLGQPVRLLSMYFTLPPGKTFTFSVYLKADREGAAVAMNFGDLKSQRCTVGTQWQRYSLAAATAQTGHFFSCVTFQLAGHATVWINAPQLEEGAEMTAFSLSPRDTVTAPGARPTPKPLPQLKLPLPKLTCPVTATPPKVDGVLDDACWRHAAVARDFRVLDDTAFAQEQTEAFIVRDSENLYVAFRCHESQMDKLTATIVARDSNVFVDDVAELFVSPLRDGRDHLHFAVNARGTVWDAVGSDSSWNAPGLQAQTGREPGAWTVEMRIPFADLQLPPTLDSTWRVNFARERAAPKREELSTWAPVVRTFHQAERYGFLEGFSPRELARFVVRPTAPPAAAGPAMPQVPPVAFLDRSFYTTEPVARVFVRLPKAGTAQATFQGKTQSVRVDRQALIPLDIAGLACGDYPVEVTAGGARQKLLLRKLPPKPNEVKIDRMHQTLIADGEPFLPFATSASAVAHIDDQAADGFNTTITLLHHQVKTEPYQALFDTAQSRGMKVIVWFHIAPDRPFEEWRDALLPLVERYKDHPALLAWYVIDEPPVGLHWLRDLLAAVKAADPYHPAFVNWCGQWVHGMDENGGDFASEDVYPIGRMSNDEAMKLIADTVGAMNGDAARSGKVVSFWHVFYGSYDSPREPTPLEEQCLTYVSLVHGCRALYYYLYKPMSVSLWKSMLPLSQEMQALVPAFNGDEVTAQVSADNVAIHYAAFRAGGATYLLAVNTTDRAQHCRLRFQWKPSAEAEVLFENRRLPCRQGLEDEFGPLARHVYVMH
jgi:hypothetical protein